MKYSEEFKTRVIDDALDGEVYKLESVNRELFDCYLLALWTKLQKSKSPHKEDQIGYIEFMQRQLQRQKYLHVVHHAQTKLLHEHIRQITKLEMDLEESRKELNEIKRNLPL